MQVEEVDTCENLTKEIELQYALQHESKFKHVSIILKVRVIRLSKTLKFFISIDIICKINVANLPPTPTPTHYTR